jgi:hypothetical protein
VRSGERDLAALVRGLAGNAPLGSKVVAEIVERTDGVPLCIDEGSARTGQPGQRYDARSQRIPPIAAPPKIAITSHPTPPPIAQSAAPTTAHPPISSNARLRPSQNKFCHVPEVDNPIIQVQTFYSGVSPIAFRNRTGVRQQCRYPGDQRVGSTAES